ncbi:armadillo-type protein [Entophlyctis helioformis]|nr:armadillo-type protein [Entophlyctis helioformis]
MHTSQAEQRMEDVKATSAAEPATYAVAGTDMAAATETGADLSDDLQRQHDEILQSIQRDINVLGETTSDRMSKRRSLERIQRETLNARGPAASLDPRVQSKVFASILRTILRAVSDPVEKCRELSIAIIAGFTKRVDSIIPFLPYIVPTFAARLGQPDIVEPAEELRYLMVQTLLAIVQAANAGYAPFVEDTVKILARTLADTYPEVKKESCKLVILLCKSNPRPVAFHGDAVAKAVLPTLQHRHSSVRTIGMDALGAAIIVDAAGLDASLDVLRAVAFDKAHAVREMLYRVARLWLVELTDRYTYGYKILPLMFAGLTDEMPKLREMCSKYMDEIGSLYEVEWESRIKDEIDYSDGWNHLPNRPRVGCRHLARDNIQKVTSKLVEGLTDWSVETRTKSCQIMGVFITFTEDQITGYVNVILPALYKILAGDEQQVMAEALKVAEMLGAYVNPDTTLSLIFPQLSMGGGGATSFRQGCLCTLHGVLGGSSPAAFAPHIQRTVDILGDRELVQNENSLVLLDLSRCIHDVVIKMDGGSVDLTAGDGGVAFKLFMSLAQLESATGDDKTPGYLEMRRSFRKHRPVFATKIGDSDNVDGLYGHFFDAAIRLLADTHTTWTKHSAERRVLDTVLVRARGLVGARLDSVLPILASCAAMERDYEVRESVLLILIRLLADPAAPLNSQDQMPVHSMQLIKGIIGLLRVDTVNALLETDLLPVVMSNLDDDEVATRQATLEIMSLLLGSHVDWKAPELKKVYPELLKRMDDAQDSLRILCATVWRSFFAAVSAWLARVAHLRTAASDLKLSVVQAADGSVVEVGLDSVHWHAMIKGLLIHMDDTNSQVQDAVCETLKYGVLAVLPRDVLRDEVAAVRSKHRSSRFIDALLSV